MSGFVRHGKRFGRSLWLTLAAGREQWISALAIGLLLSMAVGFFASARAADLASRWFVTDQGRVRLVAGRNSLGPDGAVPLGLEFDLKPHWKIYWRSPGDAGYPPRLDWTGSHNLQGATVGWPAPRRFSVLGLETVGYEGRVVLPIAAIAAKPGQPVALQAALAYLTCSDICVPYETKLALDLPAGDGAPSADAALIARFVAREPLRQQTATLALRSAEIIPGSRPQLELRVAAEPPLEAPDAFIEAPGLAFGAPRLAPGERANETVLRLAMTGERAHAATAAPGRFDITLVDGDRALETTVTPDIGPPAPDVDFFLRMIGVALLGGFILNFMPCVLPVLSLKLLGIAGVGGRARAQVRLGLLASAAGVIASFLVLAAATIGLREAGFVVGWGVQFQQPLFLIFMMALVTLFAANLWGLFEFPLPSAIAQWGGGQTRGVVGNFAAGAFATLLATPCSAPFVGTALGFAFAENAAVILAIFLALGIGLAAPYLAIAALPRLVAWLPRPGRWTIVLRRVLGLALAATALWLAWVLQAERGTVAALAALGLMICVPLAFYLLRRLRMARGAVVAALVALAFLIPDSVPAPPPAAASLGLWQPFDPGAIARLVDDGRTVFVDVTADWCLTCKLNERLAIDTPAVRRRLQAAGVVAMRADWTRPNGAIERYLQGFGRYGIPFNAVYGPAVPQGRALPELLTPGEVATALDASRKGG
ncbi:MAG TPA: protein-disulfide reductase DsbD domain-containing protein [Stellaceae bacterium]|nr:protein-disulfide reductase DsbD domain-containing protein [Stellaceae bacterium]